MKIRRKPEWLKIKIGGGKGGSRVRQILDKYKLNTVCDSAECPNRGECYERRVATFLILGNICTRGCTFCSVTSGTPEKIDESEAENLAYAAKELNLKHVVITSVTRDDLEDGGVNHFVKCVENVLENSPETTVEVLTPDFKGDKNAIKKICESGISVYNHNIETVKRFYGVIRLGADYDTSLDILKYASGFEGIIIKSGFMVGLGETKEEINDLMDDLFIHGVRSLTIGQYLQPRRVNVEVEKYYSPEEFAELEELARKKGFIYINSGPLVRSSYHAEEFQD